MIMAYFGPLIEGGLRDEVTGLYILKLNPDLVKLYGAGMWTAIDWEQRQALRRKPLVLWVHGFYSSHADPYPMKIEKLMQLSGLQAVASKSTSEGPDRANRLQYGQANNQKSERRRDNAFFR